MFNDEKQFAKDSHLIMCGHHWLGQQIFHYFPTFPLSTDLLLQSVRNASSELHLLPPWDWQ